MIESARVFKIQCTTMLRMQKRRILCTRFTNTKYENTGEGCVSQLNRRECARDGHRDIIL